MKACWIMIPLVALAACTTTGGDGDAATATPSPATAPTVTDQAPATAPEPAPALEPSADQERLTLAIEGMHCTGCAAGVDRRLRAVDGVADCRVDFESGRAVVVYDPSATDAAALASASVAGTTYSVAPLP